jgi:hypothetical protein
MSLTKHWAEETGALEYAEQDEQAAAEWAKKKRRDAEKLAEQLNEDNSNRG